ncbi:MULTISPECIES: response regulator [unclassified Caballeronia]|uniref:response regulator n=1 Tax=unclassified Caballeronia TaxID=2646786 RepID=UPI0028554E3C|nr:MULTISPECIES: response regulator [unclassified Caballeronia]MDR5777759.1 response regulator [Caballeronia sp. LZ002]MDR5853194.1 response regulator [Caballeronia sp. LZ003]
MLILFVEDDSRLADAFGALANDLGHRAEVAYDGATALKLIANTVYDAIFLDLGLPDIDGRHLCQQLRDASRNSQACVVAITGQADLSEQDLVQFDGYLLKPVDREALEAVISGC